MTSFVRLMSNLVLAKTSLLLTVRHILQKAVGNLERSRRYFFFFCRPVYFCIISANRGGNSDFLGMPTVSLFNNNVSLI